MQQAYVRRIEVRFYAELNDFFPADRQYKTLGVQSREASSIREIVKEMGVPLSLVDLVLVNGDSVDFSYVPQNGDRISVYPVFETFDISTVTNVHPRPLREIRFVLDVHLGKLAHALRMFGFDSLFLTDCSSADLISASVNESRILLSRNRTLLSSKQLTRAYVVRSQHPIEQLKEIFERFDLYRVSAPLSRCLRCNTLLQPVDKTEVLAAIPANVGKSVRDFRRCALCGRVYWKGSHYARMLKSISEFLDSAHSPLQL